MLVCMNAYGAIIGEETMVNLTLADGLAGETTYKVMTAHDGTTWIATSNGVSVFNGKQMHTLRIIDEQGQSVAVRDLCELKDHTINAATDAGLYHISGNTWGFKRVLPQVERITCLMAVGDTLYIGGEQGLQYYVGNELRHIDIDVSKSGLSNIVRQYTRDENGKIWFLGRFDLNSFDPKTGKIEQHQPSLNERRIALSDFALLGNGRFVVGTRANGLFLCNLLSGTTEPIEGIGNIISTVQYSADGYVCVATDGAGAYMLDGKTLEIKEHFSTEGSGRNRLPSNGVYCYYRDPNGVNWFGFVRYGLAFTYHYGHTFQPFSVADFTSEGLNVRTFCKHGDDLVIGMPNGFYHVNAQTGSSRFYSSKDLGGGHIVNKAVWYNGCFYIGTFDGGMRVFDPDKQTVGKQTFSPIFDDGSIGDMKVDSSGRLWVGCTEGLVIIDDGKVEQHFTEQNSRILRGLILSITFDDSDNAWLTGASGCSLYSSRSKSIVETTFPKGFFSRMPWMYGAKGHDGLVFMRTGPQTFYTNQQMTDFGELTLPVAFSDKWCRSFIDDMKGHYLLGTERGVFCFDYDLKGMRHFGYGEGLRGDFINDMLLDQDGRLWVATSQGLFYADLTNLTVTDEQSPYKVRLYDIRRGVDLLEMYEEFSANESRRIKLGWNLTSEVMQAYPVLPDYSKQAGRLYEYHIDNGEWIPVDDGQYLDIRHLGLGKHRLEVRLAGKAGTASVYTIAVVPSAWAVFEMILLIIAIGLLWLWWRFRKTTKVLLSERDEIEDALIESEEFLAKLSDEVERGVKSEQLFEEPTEKYQKVKVDEDECAEIVQRMKDYIERNKVYTNVDLKMKDLADVLHLSAPKLSQVFNLYLKENYYDFINRYRLNEFKRLIEEGAYKRFTITSLSEQCGFKKSNFFSTFRKVEGMTPNEYMKKKGIKI